MKRSAEEDMSHSSKKHKHRDESRKKSNEHTMPNSTSEKQHKYSSPTSEKQKKHHSTSKFHSTSNGSHRPQHDSNNASKTQNSGPSYADALQQLPPPTSKPADVPSYTRFTVSSDIPPLPPINAPHLATAPFKHKSLLPAYDRNSTSIDVSYERLEFLGDAYIELIASRVIFVHFTHLTAGQQSQLRELLVKNETLAEFSRLYKFDERIEMASMESMLKDIRERDKWQGNKGYNKILGDVFEAYVAAAILADVENGFSVAEKWLTALWAPKLLREASQNRIHGQIVNIDLTHSPNADMLKIYNPAAKAELQKRIMGQNTKLEYESYKPSEELKGDQLGQNRHFIAVYLTGYGYERKLLGKGEGKNKVEAGNWAATEAMHGEHKGIVDECEEKLRIVKEEKRAAREAKAAEEEKK